MSLFWYALWFVVAVGLLVTVHEFGHFFVARRLGFRVLRFSVGFGRPLLKWTVGPDRIEYVLAAIPLGGYVKLLDEREGPVEAAQLPRSFTRRPHWQRIAVLLAGPAFNIVFAILVLWGMFWVNGVNEVRPVIGDVTTGSIAAQAGLRSGDEIRAVNGTPVNGMRDVVFGLLDAMSARGEADLSVVSAGGPPHAARLVVADPDTRRHLTEPAELLLGLGFEFWPPMPPVIGKVEAGGPAARAGLAAGDRVLAIDGTPVANFHDVVAIVNAHPGERITLDYSRAGVSAAASVAVASDELHGRRIGRIHIEPAPLPKTYPPALRTHLPLSVGGALTRAADEAWNMTVLQGRLFWRMVLGRVSLKNLSGPLSIAEYAGDSAEAGVAPFLSFLVLISLSLGFLNLLPIPILDGGQVAFQLVEWLKGSPLSERAQVFGQQVGIALLIVLMGVALYNDIARQFG
ncbi:MAG TPA: RIP metalloprotease RseP [Steroidobacteraceae bacterium]|nr:RIP metalloprotease RseP [Gammaproteobacteria bacterium]HEV2286705.1 RIP metalloprotease RseP [Steroidobacteraceae bacterium]